MKRNLMLLAAMVVITASFGQGRHGNRHGHRHGHQGPAMKEALSLDSVQYATIKGINKKYSERTSTLRHDSTQSFDQKKGDFKQIREERTNEINKVLTPEQRTKWSELKKERTANREAAKLEMKARRDSQLKSKLSLSDDQLQKMKTARKESFEKARKDYDSKMKSILTREQYDEWREMNQDKKERKNRR